MSSLGLRPRLDNLQTSADNCQTSEIKVPLAARKVGLQFFHVLESLKISPRNCYSRVQVIQSIHGFTAVNPFCVISKKQCPGHIYGPISKPRVPVKFPRPKKIFKSVNSIPAGLWNDFKCWDRAIMALDWFEPILKHEKMS